MTAMKDRRDGRNGTKVIWIALHTSEGLLTAQGLRDADWWKGSSHAVSDNATLLDEFSGCVDPKYAAWTLRNGNPRSVNIEQIGLAKWSRDEWMSSRLGTLRNTARWVARMSKMHGIPLVYGGIDAVRRKTPGVIQHNDYSQGTGDGDHWDCGPGYPVDYVMDLAREYAGGGTPPAPVPAPEDEMEYKDWSDVSRNKLMDDIEYRILRRATSPVPGGKRYTIQDHLWAMSRMEGTVNGLLDPQEIADLIISGLPEGDIDQATVEAGVRAVFADLSTEPSA